MWQAAEQAAKVIVDAGWKPSLTLLVAVGQALMGWISSGMWLMLVAH